VVTANVGDVDHEMIEGFYLDRMPYPFVAMFVAHFPRGRACYNAADATFKNDTSGEPLR